jgi:hypothetical protein
MENSRFSFQVARHLAWSAALSAVINGFLVCSAFFGPNTFVGSISDAVAAPPAIIANRFLTAKEHSASSFIGAAGLSLLFSFVFYWAISWLFVQALALLRSWRDNAG